jgi:hypothetical protein
VCVFVCVCFFQCVLSRVKEVTILLSSLPHTTHLSVGADIGYEEGDIGAA